MEHHADFGAQLARALGPLLPQAVRRLLPASVNLATRIVKTTSLATLLGVVEVIKVGQQIIDAHRFDYPAGTLWVYGVIFVMYFVVCWPLSMAARYLEKRWANARPDFSLPGSPRSITWPLSAMVPPWMGSRPATHLNSVDLPEPDGPMITSTFDRGARPRDGA